MENLLISLEQETRRVDFDSFDFSVKELVSMVKENIINISPEYQRKFRWPVINQSKLVESVLLGIPLPNIFMAANKDGSWELIDGVQRITSLIHFISSQEDLYNLGLKESLKLTGLDILKDFNGLTYWDLPRSIQLKLSLRPLKVTTLSDKSDLKVRFDLFERLNTGGIELSKQEIRACVYRGEFNNFLNELSLSEDFKKVVILPENSLHDGTSQELVLKFFAYKNNRNKFEHSVIDFLNNFMGESTKFFDYKKERFIFEKTFNELSQELPNGISRGNKKNTPINLYEAIAVGAADIIMENKSILGKNVSKWMANDQLTKLTSGATNSRKRLLDRIAYCYDQFL